MSSKDPSRPNIIFILSDDHGAWATGCYGNNEVVTPNLDRLAQEGIRFSNFFCTSPVCSPARASLLTGRIPSQHGVQDWIRDGNCGGDAKTYLEGLDAYTDWLSENGYTCGISGKWHLGNSKLPQKSFSHWYVHQKGGGDYYRAPMIREGKEVIEKGHITELITDDGIEFMNNHLDDDSPFYLSLHYTAPHFPWIDQHPRRFLWLYDQCEFNTCPTDEPHPWRLFCKLDDSEPPDIYDHAVEYLKWYYTAITTMDWNIGRVIDYIESKNLRESTLIVYISDNGLCCGHHGIWGKGNGTYPQNMYEESVKVPAIFSQPGRIPQHVVSDALLNGYDMMPTLLSYCNIEYEDSRKPGRDFSKVLLGDKDAEKEFTNVTIYDEYGSVRMIRTQKWKYVHRYPEGPHELFDMVEDPKETHNLIEDRSKQAIITKLRKTMEDWFEQYAIEEIDARKMNNTGKGQITFVGSKGGSGPYFYEGE